MILLPASRMVNWKTMKDLEAKGWILRESQGAECMWREKTGQEDIFGVERNLLSSEENEQVHRQRPESGTVSAKLSETRNWPLPTLGREWHLCKVAGCHSNSILPTANTVHCLCQGPLEIFQKARNISIPNQLVFCYGKMIIRCVS